MDERAATVKMLRSRIKATREEATARLCEMFEPLVRAQARSHANAKVDLDDLVQTARLGLVEACVGFPAEAKKKSWTDGAFATYATWCVRNALSKYDEGNSRLVKQPAWMHRRMPKLRRLRNRLAQELMREPTLEELAAALKMPLDAVTDMVINEEAPQTLPPVVTGETENGDQDRKHYDRLHRREKV